MSSMTLNLSSGPSSSLLFDVSSSQAISPWACLTNNASSCGISGRNTQAGISSSFGSQTHPACLVVLNAMALRHFSRSSEHFTTLDFKNGAMFENSRRQKPGMPSKFEESELFKYRKKVLLSSAGSTQGTPRGYAAGEFTC